jgi:dTDP-4-amino-4,6-dideoxygalactose transaminase
MFDNGQSVQETPAPVHVPFMDLRATNQEVAPDLMHSWTEVVSSGAFVGGPHVERFEHEWAAYCGTEFAVGVANGTDALHLVLRALGIGEGQEVIVPTNTFVATAEAVVLAGATPRFVDVDPETLLIDFDAIEAAINHRTAAVIVVHLYGQLPDMDALRRITARAGITLLEDAAQAHGATWKGQRAGSFGRAASFSFYPSKNLGALGDAGAVTTNDEEVAARIRSLGDHGRSTSTTSHVLIGTNSRLDSLQAAILCAKLPHLDRWTSARQSAVDEYRRLLDGSPVRLVRTVEGVRGAYHLNVARVSGRAEVRRLLRRRGIDTRIHYPLPCHRQRPYSRFPTEAVSVAERSAGEVVSLPLFPHITPDQVRHACDELLEVVSERSIHA